MPAQRPPRGAAALILDVFNALTAAQVVQRLDAAGIANARVNDMAGLWAHPQLAARQRWRSVDTPAGEVPALLPPGVNSAFDYRMDRCPPWASTAPPSWPSWAGREQVAALQHRRPENGPTTYARRRPP
jgi:crotonobetainyl-CoA:carnitine CoA-transferase CaiB-like acyl-CoA transferase